MMENHEVNSNHKLRSKSGESGSQGCSMMCGKIIVDRSNLKADCSDQQVKRVVGSSRRPISHVLGEAGQNPAGY